MTSIKLTITGAKARAEVSGPLTSGMVGLPVTIQYDSAWNGLTKNLVCRSGRYGPGDGETRIVLNVEERGAVAHEVMVAGRTLYLGVEGRNASGSLVIPTVWAECGTICPGANSDADPTAQPTLPVWARLQREINRLNQAGIPGERIEAAVAAYLEENPLEIPTATGKTLGGVMPVSKTASMTQPVGVDGNGRLYTAPGNAEYTLSVGGGELGGVKNGGNVTIQADGTMTAPEAEVTDEQVQTAVETYLEENPDKVTTIQDGAVGRGKLSDELLAELGLEPNHHLTEVQIPVYKTAYASWYDGTENGTGLSTKPFPVPQYIKIVSKTTAAGVSETLKARQVRFADSDDWENANYTQTIAYNIGNIREAGFLCGEVADDMTVIFPTNEYGAKGREYLQMCWQLGNWSKGTDLFELYGIYDTWRPRYELPADDGFFVEDLPVKWVYAARNSKGGYQQLFGVVPYYPDFTYYIRGGAYINTAQFGVYVAGLFDDSIFDGYHGGLNAAVSGSGVAGIHETLEAPQFDTSVSGCADRTYQWAYFSTPPESELTGLKWLAFEMRQITAGGSTDLGADYYNQLIRERNDSGAQPLYISRWNDKDAPRRLLTTLVKKGPNAPQDEGGRYNILVAGAESPLRNARWVLFGDSLTDTYGGHDLSSDYFASRIAREFGLLLDNRAHSGSNIYAGGSGNYPGISGVLTLDAYLAEVEAGTTEPADYITVAFGTNSFGTDIGSNDDTAADYTASVYGATKYFIEKIREKVPNAILGFVLSPKQQWPANADPNGLRDIDGARTAIKTVCDDYGVWYIDMSTQSGITVDMLPDGIHINSELSQKLYYHAMRRFMMGL